MITTLGIDLASQARNTALCEIAWDAGRGEVTALEHGRTLVDDTLRAAIRAGHAKVAIDAPFGWPAPFVAALAAHERLEAWPEPSGELEYRLTDRFVHTHARKLPLSVSTDRIAYCAMRCARLLSGLDAPRDGSGLVVEAYPDAALRCWLPRWFEARPAPTYKGAPSSERRERLVADLLAGLDERFSITPAWRAACVASDDCLDALLCALVARAAERGKTVGATDAQRPLALTEGWIHLPEPDSLSELVAG